MKKSESPHFFQTASALFLALQGPGKLKGLKIKKEVEYSTFVTESIRTMCREMEHFIVSLLLYGCCTGHKFNMWYQKWHTYSCYNLAFFGPSVSNDGLKLRSRFGLHFLAWNAKNKTQKVNNMNNEINCCNREQKNPKNPSGSIYGSSEGTM